MDATLVHRHKREALFCYQGTRACQPLNGWWAEQEQVVHTECRDGNVPAGHEYLRVLTEALTGLSAGVDRVSMRSDSAGYQEVLEYCAEGMHERFKVTELAVSADVTHAFRAVVREVKEEDWRPLNRVEQSGTVPTGQQWAEVCFVPTWAARRKTQPEYRFQADLPFPVIDLQSQALQALWGGDQSHRRWGADHSLAPRALRQERAGACGHEGGCGRRAVALWQFRGERRLVADHGAGPQPQHVVQA